MKRGANSEHNILVCKYDIEDKFSGVNVCILVGNVQLFVCSEKQICPRL